MAQRLIFGTWVGYYLLVAWVVIVFGIQSYFFEYGSVSERVVSLTIAWAVFLIGLKLYPLIEKRFHFCHMDRKEKKIYNPAGLEGVGSSPRKYSVGEEIKNEEVFRTIKLLPKGVYDSHEELGEAMIYFNRADVRPRPRNYGEGVQDVFGLLEALERGRVAICSKETKELYFEIKKGMYRDDTEERARYFFPDGTCFFDIRTKSITPSFQR